MQEPPLLSVYRNQVRAFQEAAESWKAQHHSAMLAADADALTADYLALTQSLDRALASVWKRLAAGQLPEVPQMGAEMLRMLTATVLLLDNHQESLTKLEKDGYEMTSRPVLEKTLVAARQRLGEFARRWPPIDAALLEEPQIANVLEELAQRFPLTKLELSELAKTHKPPQNWYDEDVNLF